ncbi:MAG: cytochrome c biogenesis protein CcsA [Ignavibacteriales bacterium]|nr:cytochrome c biogenesis protein CcsA [Ignavibacteriales bacterium]
MPVRVYFSNDGRPQKPPNGAELINDFLNGFLPLLYGGAVWLYAKAFFSDAMFAKKIKTAFLFTMIGFHAVYLLLRTAQFRHPPITTIFEIMSLIAFSVALAYAVTESLTKVKNTGYFILIPAFFFQLISSLFIQDLKEVNPILRSNLLGVHVSTALLGYTAITISAGYGFLYLMLYHNIKSNRFGVIYSKLPNLEILERMSFVSTVLGFLLISVAMVIGLVWLPKAFDSFSYFDAKLVGTLIVWGLYGMGLVAKRMFGWQGRKIMVLSLAAFVIAIFSLTAINLLFSSFHNFS